MFEILSFLREIHVIGFTFCGWKSIFQYLVQLPVNELHAGVVVASQDVRGHADDARLPSESAEGSAKVRLLPYQLSVVNHHQGRLLRFLLFQPFQGGKQ